MTDSIALGPDGQLNHALAVLRQESREGELGTDVAFLPSIKWHADPALELKGRYSSPEGRLLELDSQPAGRGGWNALHLSFPARNLRPYGALGFALRSSSPEIQVVRACIRSGVEGGFEDCFFSKHILVRAEESSHIDALPTHQQPRLPLEAPWRELVLFFPTDPFQMSLIDLRVFLV